MATMTTTLKPRVLPPLRFVAQTGPKGVPAATDDGPGRATGEVLVYYLAGIGPPREEWVPLDLENRKTSPVTPNRRVAVVMGDDGRGLIVCRL